MPLVDNAWYVNYGDGATTGYYAVLPWAALTAYPAGAIRRQLAAPAVGSERLFICIVAGTTLAAEPAWVLTRGAKTAEAAGPTWQECTGQTSLNGDLTNTPSWTVGASGGVKNIAVVLGQIIKRDNLASYQICTTAGTAGNGAEPAFSDTAGVTTADNTVTWTSLGVVGNFTGWQAPHARLGNAYAATWGGGGDAFFLASEHAETQASALTLTSPGTLALPCSIYSVSKTTVPPVAVTAGASIATTGASTITLAGNGQYYKGIKFSAGSAANVASILVANSTNSFTVYDGCTFTFNNSSASSRFTMGVTGAKARFISCTWNMGDNATQQFNTSTSLAAFEIIGGIINVQTNIATNIFGSCGSALFIDGLDLSAFGSGKTIAPNNTNVPSTFIAKNCRLNANVTKSTTPNIPGQKNIFILSDSAATNYLTDLYSYYGTQTVETTIIRTGGATDGITPISWKLVTSANSKFITPLETLPIAVQNDVVGTPVTVTVYGIGAALPNNDEIWIEASYMGSASSPLSTLAVGTKDSPLATGTAQASDSSTWGGGTAAFKMQVTFTPQMKGKVYVTVKAAKASTTYYIDPAAALS